MAKAKSKHFDFLLGGIVVILALIFLNQKLKPKSSPQKITRATQSQTETVDLASYSGLNSYGRLSEHNQQLLKSAIRRHCLIKYHAKSCIHHYLTCGSHCKPLLSRTAKTKMVRDYEHFSSQL